jgi:hypothetical protein
MSDDDIWLKKTPHNRDEDTENWIGFDDDNIWLRLPPDRKQKHPDSI